MAWRVGMAGVILWAGCATTACAAEATDPQLVVRLLGMPRYVGPDVLLGRHIATGILASSGVRLRWARETSAEPERLSVECGTVPAIDVRIVYSTPADPDRRALAEALPLARSGVRITVFYDRVESAAGKDLTGFVLGHVLAHELGHILLQSAAHAESGLMKAEWTLVDHGRMRKRPIGFSAEEAAAIRRRLIQAGSRACAGNPTAQNRK